MSHLVFHPMRFVKKFILYCVLQGFVDVGFFERVCFGIDVFSAVASIFNNGKIVKKRVKNDVFFEIDFWTVLGTVLGLILGGFWEAKLKRRG